LGRRARGDYNRKGGTNVLLGEKIPRRFFEEPIQKELTGLLNSERSTQGTMKKKTHRKKRAWLLKTFPGNTSKKTHNKKRMVRRGLSGRSKKGGVRQGRRWA